MTANLNYARAKEKLLADPTVTDWVKQQILALDHRDTADAMNDLELLMELLIVRFNEQISHSFFN